MDRPGPRASLLRGQIATLDVVALAQCAASLFAAAARPVHVRWLTFELTGYQQAGYRLSEILGPAAPERLVAHIAAYRGQTATVAEAGTVFRHFFIEPLADIATAALDIRRIGFLHQPIRLSFPPGGPVPPTLVFPGDVFERVLLGFRATVHLQLGSVFL